MKRILAGILFLTFILFSINTNAASWISMESLKTEATFAPPHAEPVLANWDMVGRYRLRQIAGVEIYKRFHIEADLKIWYGVPWQAPCNIVDSSIRSTPHNWYDMNPDSKYSTMCQKEGWAAWGSNDWDPKTYRADITFRVLIDIAGPVSLLWERNEYMERFSGDGGTYYNLVGFQIDWTKLWEKK